MRRKLRQRIVHLFGKAYWWDVDDKTGQLILRPALWINNAKGKK